MPGSRFSGMGASLQRMVGCLAEDAEVAVSIFAGRSGRAAIMYKGDWKEDKKRGPENVRARGVVEC